MIPCETGACTPALATCVFRFAGLYGQYGIGAGLGPAWRPGGGGRPSCRPLGVRRSSATAAEHAQRKNPKTSQTGPKCRRFEDNEEPLDRSPPGNPLPKPGFNQAATLYQRSLITTHRDGFPRLSDGVAHRVRCPQHRPRRGGGSSSGEGPCKGNSRVASGGTRHRKALSFGLRRAP